jgi:transcriptional regulator with XRE-family HTH domain
VYRIAKKKGYTQSDLAVHLSEIELGKREAEIITLPVIARGLDTTLANLLRGLYSSLLTRSAVSLFPNKAKYDFVETKKESAEE